MGQGSGKPKLSPEQIRDLQRHVSFSEEEIHDWWKEFIGRTRRDHSGQMFLTEEEFVKVYNSVFPGQCQEFARHVFRSFDLDRNGRVDFREFLIGLSVSGSMDLEKKLRWAFLVYDVDQRGFITRKGMVQIIKSVFRMIGPCETGDIRSPEEIADQLFSELDRDKDDLISWKEFRDGAAKHPEVINLLQCSPPQEEEDQRETDIGD